MISTPGLADIIAAAARLDGHAVTTPLLESHDLNARAGGRVLIKAECLQRTGSFKFRGAYNRMAQMTAAERATGVVACSSGNHAQGVAAAAALLDMPAVIVMPRDAPAIKIEKTQAYGAELLFYDRLTDDREAIAGRIAAERGAVFVSPYDDPHVIAGQGTVGFEMMEQSERLGLAIDIILVCCSGGGLAAGVAIAATAMDADVEIYAVEPEGFDDTGRSLAAGKPLRNDRLSGSICDSLMAPAPGVVTFPINQDLLAGGLAVSDDEVRAAMRYAFDMLRLVVEPGGAVGLAAVLSGRIETEDRVTAIILSGGNVDPAFYASVLGGA